MKEKEIVTFYASDRQKWRQWLKKNHAKEQSVWLLCYKKQANKPTISWSDAVDEALCFGWIDSTRKSLGGDRFVQFFCRRKPMSHWSKINKAKIERLTNEGLMTKAGMASVELAKENGSWTALDPVEELIIPKDLATAFRLHPGSKKYFTGLSKSAQKILLHWVAMAKRPDTRQKRIAELAEQAGRQTKPKQFL